MALRIALAQVNTTVGDFAGNLALAREAAVAAARAGAQLVVLPELALCGYLPRDLLDEPSFLDACDDALHALATTPGLPPLLVGAADREAGVGKPLLNTAVLLAGGRLRVVAKRLLPTYDVFDEARYFRPGAAGAPIEIAGVQVGVTICEDLWPGPLYAPDPAAELVAAGAELIVNLSASPYAQGKPAFRAALVQGHARRLGVPVVLCNVVGANDQLVFDGNSCAADATGALVACAAGFEPDVLVTDFTAAAPCAPTDDVGAAIRLGIRDYFAKTGFQRALIGMSGGIDSSLVACLAVEALGADNVTGVSMPGPFNADYSRTDAAELAKTLGMRFEVAPIAAGFATMRETLGGVWGDDVTFGLPEENLQARLRGTILMALANRWNALVLVPSNKSEVAMGYCTLYGDMVGALAPISDLYKTEVYALARRYPIPARIIERPPSAELRPDQKDEDSLPPYEVLDAILRLHLEERRRPAQILAAGFDEAVVRRVLRTVARSEYKRQQGAPVLKLTAKAFDLGRRFPIVERFGGGA